MYGLIFGRNVGCISISETGAFDAMRARVHRPFDFFDARGILFPSPPALANTASENFLVEEAEDLASDVLPPGLLVVHDAGGGGEDDAAELTRGEELDDPLLEVAELDVVAGADDAGLVEAAVELDDDLAVAVVIDLLELSDVTCKSNC